MSYTIKASEVEEYKGCRGYVKQRANLTAVDPEGKESKVGYAKAEPVLNAVGELVSWVWYVRPHGFKLGPIFHQSLRATTDHAQTLYNEQVAYVPPARATDYTKAPDFVDPDAAD